MPDESTAAQAASTEGAAADTGAALSTPVEQSDAAPEAVASDWRASITNPEHKELAERLASPADAVKAAYDMRREASKYVKRLGKDSTPEEIEAFRNAVGAGQDAEAYLKAIPAPAEGAEYTETDKALHAATAAVLHKHNVPVAAMGELGEVVAKLVEGVEAENDRVAIKGRKDAEADLRREWGADYEGNLAIIRRTVAEYGGESFRDFMNDAYVGGVKFGDHPAFLRAWGRMAREFGGAKGMPVGVEDRQSIQGQIDEIYRQHPVGSASLGSVAVQGELANLHKQLVGDNPIVGRGRGV